MLSTAMSFLGLYRDPTVAAVTSRLRLADRRPGRRRRGRSRSISSSRHPTSRRTKPLVRLVLNQIGRRLTERLEGDPGKRRKHQLLMMLDEFPALGRLDFFETALAFMAGYGIRAFLIAQILNQIAKAYGENNAILDNCHVRIAFATNDERTAKRISDALGTATELRAQRNYAGHRLAPWLAHVMVSRQETARPLLTPGEVMQLPPTDELVLVSGLAPIRAKKLRYYEDRNFTARVAAAAGAGRRRLSRPARAAAGRLGRPGARPDARLAAAVDEEAACRRRRRAAAAAPSRPAGRGRRQADRAEHEPIRSASPTTTSTPPPTSAPWTGCAALERRRARPCHQRRRQAAATTCCRLSEDAAMRNKVRHQLFLDADLSERLEALAAKPGASKSAILADALDRLAQPPRRARARRALRSASRPRSARQLGRIERDGQVLLETPGAVRPLPADRHRATARSRSGRRAPSAATGFEAFVDQVGRQLAGGGRTPRRPRPTETETP